MDRSGPHGRRGMSLITILLIVALAGLALFYGLRMRRQAAAAAAGPSAQQAEAEFRASHKLNGVSIANNGRVAIIDGRAMAVGQSVDGRTLVEVTDRSATFRSAGGDIVLNLPQKRAPGRIEPATRPASAFAR